MDRRTALALVVYAALVGSLLTPLYDPLAAGRDDSWTLLVLLAAAHLGAGVAVRRAWVLLAPIGLGFGSFVFAGAGGPAWLILLFEVPLLVPVTPLGAWRQPTSQPRAARRGARVRRCCVARSNGGQARSSTGRRRTRRAIAANARGCSASSSRPAERLVAPPILLA